MQEMNLNSSKETTVIVIGVMNRSSDLDDAVLRRLPRRLLLHLPGERERKGLCPTNCPVPLSVPSRCLLIATTF